jgi:DNA-binding MarR family transcriptional regulator
MSPPLPFARFIHMIKAIEALPVPTKIFNRYRMEYDLILTQLCVSASIGEHLTVSDFLGCSILGSQPTANKRLQELVKYGLIEHKLGDDRRIKILGLTDAGNNYLVACSVAMTQAIAPQATT